VIVVSKIELQSERDVRFILNNENSRHVSLPANGS
jgi:hypothetical protein